MKQLAGQSVSGWISILVAAALSLVRPASAACVPPGTSGDDRIVCTDSDLAGVRAGGGNDAVSVAQGAEIRIEASGPGLEAVAVDTGAGNDTASNAGSITVDAQAVLQPVIVFPSVPASTWDITSTADAVALGVWGGTERDSFLNFATLGVSSHAHVGSVAVEGTLNNVATVLAPSTALAHSTGAGGAGAITIVNGGLVEASANAAADALRVSVSVFGGINPVWVGGTNSDAIATGLAGAASADSIENLGTLVVNATAASRSSSASLTLDGFVAAATASKASALSTGILGAGDADTLTNIGAMQVGASAISQGVSIGLGISVGVRGDAVGEALSDANVHATADAIGIDGGDGQDIIRNAGRISADATSNATAAGASVDVSVSKEGSVQGAALSDAGVISTAAATGIDGGAGADDIGSDEVVVSAQATATGVAASISVAGSVEGALTGKALSDARVTASATTVGIAAGDGNDKVASDGRIGSNATATATGVSVSLPVTISRGAQANGSALSDASVTATAHSLGIDTSGGIDGIATTGRIDADANAQATGVAVALSVTGSVQGAATGEALSDASVHATAAATGIAAGDGADTVGNGAVIDVSAGAAGVGASVAVPVVLANEGNVQGSALSKTSVGASAVATGIDAGSDSGADTIENSGGMVVMGTSTATGVAASLTVAGTAKGDVKGSALSDSSVLAESALVGVATHGGNDRVTNTAMLEGMSSASATGVSASVKVGFTKEGDVAADASAEGGAMSDASSTARAQAAGIDAGAGADTIDNGGAISLNAMAHATGVAASLDVAGSAKGDAKGKALSGAAVTADATMRGIAAGDGADTINNAERIGATAAATGIGASVSVPVAISKEGKAEGSALSNVSVTASALAAGIDAGADTSGDTVTNDGEIAALGMANATGVAASVSVAGTAKGDAKGSALSDSSVTATATADGVTSGAGNDRVTNTGRIGAAADAEALGVSASVKVGFTKEGNVAAEAKAEGAAMSNASSTAAARAVSIDTGAGNDTIGNQGEVETSATSHATGVAASLDVAGSAKGDVAGAALSDAAVKADATAFGVAAGDGVDTITNTERVGVTATATGAGASASVPVAISKEGKAEGSAISKVSVGANAAATGIDAGSDASGDSIANSGDIATVGTATATGVAASITVAGTAKGDVKGSALSDSSVLAESAVQGIVSHGGNDNVTNTAKVEGTSTATAVGVSAAVKVGFTKEGNVAAEAKAEGAAMSNAASTARAAATGIDTGSGNDTVDNRGELAISSTSHATGVAASLDVAGSAKGDVAGAALSDAAVKADAATFGVAAGDGVDTITNAARIGATATATGVGVSASVPVAISKEGKAEGSAISKVSVGANAAATGVDTGTDASGDTITNSGEIDVEGTAEATGVAASITVAGTAKGDVKGSALSDSSVTASAAADGLSAGGGNDKVTNEARVGATADATATGVSATVRVGFSKDGKVEADASAEGSAVSKASSTAAARAGGIDTGDGADDIQNHGEVAVRAVSTATGVAASLDMAGSAKGDVAGGALADASVTATAAASGISAGAGNDRVTNDNAVSGDAAAKATGAAVGLSVSITKEGKAEGKAVSDASATATAAVKGIDGGDGDDTISNSGTIRLQHLVGENDGTEADAKAIAASVGVAGSAKGEVTAKALADASATAEADASGIAAGAGADTITNSGRIVADMDATAITVAASVGVAVTIDSSENPDAANATGSAVSDASATAIARSRGIDTGPGVNVVTNTGEIALGSTANATSVAVSLSVGGTAKGDASAEALSKASSTAQAQSMGIVGGADADDLDNREKIDARANATATTVAASVGVAITLDGAASGTSLSDSSATAAAGAAGLDGGDGKNTIDNTAAITTAAESHATSVAVALTVAGTAQGDAKGSALAKAASAAESVSTAVLSGSGVDTIANHGALTVDAVATGKTVAVGAGVSLSLGGSAENAALSDASSSARAVATAIDAGAGDDTVTNDAAIVLMPSAPNTNDTEAKAESVAVSVTVTGALGGDTKGKALSNASATADAQATGIAAGGGNDEVTNDGAMSGEIDAYAKSVAAAAGVAVTVGGSAQGSAVSDASSTARARAYGITGGEGADTIGNAGAITLKSGATADGVSLSIFLGGSLGTSDQSAIANTRTTADALTIALDGGAGKDRIENSGNVTVGATSVLEGKSYAVNVNLLSGGLSTQSAVADVSGVASATAAAIAGGDDADYLRNTAAKLDVTAASTAKTSAYSISLSGLSVGSGTKTSMTDARTSATSSATGIAGGDGTDDVATSGTSKVLAKATSEGYATTRNISIVSLGGDLQDAAAKSTTTAQAVARGLDGGGADDRLAAQGNLDIDAEATVTGAATAANVSGLGVGSTSQKSVAQAGTVADAQAVGIDGGAGGNVIDNAATVTVDAIAGGTTKSVSASVTGFNLAGATYQDAAADASSTLGAQAIGLRGGDGVDSIGSTGTLSVKATSTGNVVSRAEVESLTFFGSAKGKAAADASSLISATAAGIEGGAGDDAITSSGTVTVDAIAEGTTNADSKAKSKVAFGSASAKSATSAAGVVETTATGIAGGAGSDDIDSTALVDVDANAKLTVTASSVSVASSTFGSAYAASAADSSSTTRASAAGIDGGDDADEIRNEGGVTVDVHAATTVNQTSTAIASSTFGSENTVANSNATATADAAATGIAGGGGDDHIVSPAFVSATAEGSVTMQRLTLSSDGPATADARTQTQASAVGVDGGTGNDVIEVTGDVTATATGTVGSGSRTGGDKVDEDVRITVSTRAVGITGGAGNDAITSAGTMNVWAHSTLDSQAVTFSGLAVLKSRLMADATAVGMEGGDGSDTLSSQTALAVNATADVTSKQSTYTFSGGEGTSFLQAQSTAAAFGASGALEVVSSENVNSAATSTVKAEDTTISFRGYVTKELRGRALSTATGLSGGTLDDGLENRARLTAYGSSTVSSTGKVTVDFDEGTDQQMGFEALANALGASTGAGHDSVVNTASGVMTVDAIAGATVNGVTSTCDGFWGCGFGFWGNTKKTFNWADARAESSAIGLELGEGNDRVDNAGEITVKSTATADASAISNADFYNESEAYADGTARAQAWGIRGTGADQVLNQASGIISVTATAGAEATAQGGKIGGTEADLKSAVSAAAAALSTTFVDSSQKNVADSEFVGKWVRFLTGANTDVYAQVTAFDTATGQFTLDTALVGALVAGDGYTVSEARNAISGAFASATVTGIELQGGDAAVQNDGALDVTATATADNVATVYGGASVVGSSASAMARGIVTGIGNDTVVNNGSIVVLAEAKARIDIFPTDDMTATATGIDSGAGNDLIVNNGTIDARTKVLGLFHGTVTELGTAITAGAGNDHLVLGPTSVTRGYVFLDEGDDKLTLRGNASVITLAGTPGSVDGGTGFDTVVFDGAGLFRAGLVSFEGVTKQGSGTFTVPALPTMQRVELLEGALETDSGYVFAPGGEFRSWVYGEHGNGTLLVNNGNATLGGDLVVAKGHGAYVDGSTYTVLRTTSGGAVVGSFNQVVLPQPTALVSFAFDQRPDALQVRALVGSFDIVAGNDLERAMASYLDRILPTASGDLSDVLGELQNLPASEAGAAMASLSPGAFESTTRTSVSLAGQYAHTLERHLAGLRSSGLPGAGGIGAYLPSGATQQPVFLAYNDLAANTDAGVGGTVGKLAQIEAAKRYGVWLDSFGQWGQQDAVAGYTGLKYDMAGLTLGFDYAFSDHFIGGIGGYMTRTRTDSSNGTAQGNTDTGGASLYGTWFSGPWYVDGLLSYARQSYDNTRRISVGGTQRTATSTHGGDVASAFLGGGYDVRRGDWVFGPFASLQYAYLEEDDFTETGAGSLNLQVDARNTDSLVGQAGLRVARVIEHGNGKFVPEARVAYNHDFDTGDRVVRASFAGASGAAFSIAGAPVTSSGMTYGLGVTYLHRSGFSTSLQFNGEARDGYEAYGVLGYVRFTF